MTPGDASTIFALSSGHPPAAIAIVRISGARAGPVLRHLAGRLPPPRRAIHTRLRDGEDLIDHALVLWFPGPSTATGEDLAELHLHGGRAVVQRALDAIARMPDCRIAMPGEFTRRALENGRIDLAEAEGLADLLSAETEAQRRQAMRIVEGGVGRRIADWREGLLIVAATIEALIEFAEDDDLDDVDVAPQHAAIERIATGIAAALAEPPAERLRDGVRVVLAGPPNAGKSSLLNALADREAAIATEIAGTTRDLIEVPVMRGGVPFILVDTAGLRMSDDPIERIGVARSETAIENADLVLWLGDEADLPAVDRVIPLVARADARDDADNGNLRVSSRTGEGLDRLWRRLVDEALILLPSEDMVALNQRHRTALAVAFTALRDRPDDPILLAENVRTALVAFDRIVGAAGVEAMLDTLFGRFCVGK